jgi:DNA-binding NarL/FixJ family response regulator
MHIHVVDDHPLFRAAVCSVLATLPGPLQISESATCGEALALLNTGVQLSLLLLDLGLPDIGGIAALERLRQASPATPIIVLSASDSHGTIQQTIAAGAMGFIPKSTASELVIAAINVVLAGGVYLPGQVSGTGTSTGQPSPAGRTEVLTPREQEVLFLVAEGLSNKQIGDRLTMAENTVRVHVTSILRKCSARNRTEACHKAVHMGFLN